MAQDWTLIKRDYIQGYTDEDGNHKCPTLEDLCERYSCSISTMKKRSANEKWSQERNLYGTKLEQKIQNRTMNLVASEAASFDSKSLTAADSTITLIMDRMKDPKLSNHDILKLSNAIVNFQKVGKLAVGEPTEHINESGSTDVNINDRIKEYRELLNKK